MADELQLDYDPAEDRLALTIRKAGSSPETLLLTRRLVKAWCLDLRRAVDHSAAVSPELHPAARSAISAAHHRSLAAQVERASAPPVRLESADKALMVSAVRTGVSKDRRWSLRFELRSGGVRQLVLSPALLHGLVALLDRRLAEADWGLRILHAGGSPAVLSSR